MVQAEDARWGCRWCWYWTKHQTSNITTWTKHQTSTRVDREKEESMTAAVGSSLAVDWLMSVGRWWWSSGCSVVVMVKAGAAGSWSRKEREKEMSWWRRSAEGRESWCWSVLDWKCREDQRGEEKKQGRAMKEKLKEEEREEIGKEEMIVLEWRWLLLMYMVRKFSCPKSFFFK